MSYKSNSQKKFDQHANEYDQHVSIQKKAGQFLSENIQSLHIKPKRILDLGAGTGYLTQLLAKQFPKASIDLLDISPKMLEIAKKKITIPFFKTPPRYFCASAENTPIKANSYSMVASNLMLQWTDFSKTACECWRILKPGGLFVFSTLGPSSLSEIHKTFQAVLNDEHAVNPFLSLFNIGDTLNQLSFSDCVTSNHLIHEHFSSFKELLYSVKKIGSYRVKNNPTPMTPKTFKSMETYYQRWWDEKKNYPLSYELIFGHAWKKSHGKQQAFNVQNILD